MEAELPLVIGRTFKCCSRDCLEEMNWREVLSIMNKTYYKKREKQNE
jgi:hypothetical protein